MSFWLMPWPLLSWPLMPGPVISWAAATQLPAAYWQSLLRLSAVEARSAEIIPFPARHAKRAGAR